MKHDGTSVRSALKSVTGKEGVSQKNIFKLYCGHLCVWIWWCLNGVGVSNFDPYRYKDTWHFMSYHISDIIHLWTSLVASIVIFYKCSVLTIFLQDRHDAHMVWTISSNLVKCFSMNNHPPTSHLTFFPPHNSNSTLQTCRDQWEVVRGWELGWISKTQRRWTLIWN